MDSTRSSLLGNLHVDHEGAEFTLDGQLIRLRGDRRSPALAALRELHEHALSDYRMQQALSNQRNGGWKRLAAWLGRLWQNRISVLSAISVRGSNAWAAPALVPTPGNTAGTAFSSSANVGQNQPPSVGSIPRLQAMFADADGVQVVWQEPGPETVNGVTRAKPNLTQFTYARDSEIAHGLERCFQELAVLGYKVTGLEPAAQTLSPRDPSVSTSARESNATPTEGGAPVDVGRRSEPSLTSPTNDRPVALNGDPPAPGTVADPAASSSKAEIVMRLHPPSADHPTRAVVSPVAGAEEPEILIAPERLLHALHHAAQTSIPAHERLHYLRCARSEKGLEIIAVGFGETTGGKPARWEDAKAWWKDRGTNLASALSTTVPPGESLMPGPNHPVGTSPLQPHVETASDKSSPARPRPILRGGPEPA